MAIRADFARAKFPTLDALAHIAEPPPGCNLSDHNTFVCHGFDDRVVMVLQRYDRKDGSKGFLSWTRWSDGQWRNMEPDTLPFFGLPGARDHTTLFIHEGPKAAARVKRLIAGEAGSARFPWREELRWGHHIGWLGGFHAVDRSDWEALARQGWKRVVIVADNDAPGWRIVGRIAKHFRCPTQVVRFGGDFPQGFDLGDDFPAAMFTETGRYTGPSFAECCQPADWATELVEMPRENGRGVKLVPVLRENFVEQCAVVTETQQVFHRDRPAHGLTMKQFNDECRWRSDTKDTFAELLKHGEAIFARRVYEPSADPGPLIVDGELCWNGYEPPKVRPIHSDAAPFFDFITHLIPFETDRREVLRWVATVIAKPDVRVRYSLLLISKRQGVGKTTLGVVLKALLGASNVSFPGEKSISDSAFNTWALGKRVIVVNEIYSNGRSTVYDKLKPYVTDEDIEINAKFVQPFTIKNCAVLLACSNSEKALYIPDDDRRWLIPTVTDQVKPVEWWEEFYRWLGVDGAGIILHWAREFVKRDYVRTGERAPASSAKSKIIEASKSEGRIIAREFAEEFVKLGERAIVRVSDLQGWVAAKRHMSRDNPHLEKERTLIDEVEGVAGIRVLKGDARPQIGGRKGGKASVILNFEPDRGTPWSELEPCLRTMQQIGFHDDF